MPACVYMIADLPFARQMPKEGRRRKAVVGWRSPQLDLNLTSEPIPAREAETGYSHPFPSDFSLVPGLDATKLASLSSLRAARRRERDPSRVRPGSSNPE